MAGQEQEASTPRVPRSRQNAIHANRMRPPDDPADRRPEGGKPSSRCGRSESHRIGWMLMRHGCQSGRIEMRNGAGVLKCTHSLNALLAPHA